MEGVTQQRTSMMVWFPLLTFFELDCRHVLFFAAAGPAELDTHTQKKKDPFIGNFNAQPSPDRRQHHLPGAAATPRLHNNNQHIVLSRCIPYKCAHASEYDTRSVTTCSVHQSGATVTLSAILRASQCASDMCYMWCMGRECKSMCWSRVVRWDSDARASM